ncbi:MAG TPA: hypothetical protein VFV33_11820 [Gemmatimonadaceae bacterium]|nr:hypothetical protein [Gemmatimonadaceae bacterium]
MISFRFRPVVTARSILALAVAACVVAACGVAAFSLAATPAGAQSPNPRFGRWKLKSDAPAPASNIMTYEASGATGMKVTIESVSAKGDTTRWWYVTAFDGAPSPVSGNPGQTHAAVRRIDDRINEIVNSKDGVVTQRLTNILSPDGNTIAVVYMRDDGAGRTVGVSFATYERMR